MILIFHIDLIYEVVVKIFIFDLFFGDNSSTRSICDIICESIIGPLIIIPYIG
ncbi:hypothetical protein ACJX0J_035112, partial [Zea mays]